MDMKHVEEKVEVKENIEEAVRLMGIMDWGTSDEKEDKKFDELEWEELMTYVRIYDEREREFVIEAWERKTGRGRVIERKEDEGLDNEEEMKFPEMKEVKERDFNVFSGGTEREVLRQEDQWNIVTELKDEKKRFDFSTGEIDVENLDLSYKSRLAFSSGLKIWADYIPKFRERPLRVGDDEQAAYLGAMIRDGILERGKTLLHINHFFVRSPVKTGKLRLIFDGRPLNNALGMAPKFRMKAYRTVLNQAVRNNWAFTMDWKNGYFQMRIDEKSRHLLGINIKGHGRFRYTRAPFGINWCPFWFHVASDDTVRQRRREGIMISHYLDDEWGMSKEREENEETLRRNEEWMRRKNIVMSKQKTKRTTQRIEILGLDIDLRNKEVGIPEKMEKRIEEKMKKRNRTKREWAGIVGSFIFMNHAWPGTLSQMGKMIEVMKKNTMKMWEEEMNGEEIKKEGMEILRKVRGRRMKIQYFTEEEEKETIWFDSSMEAGGLVTKEGSWRVDIPKIKMILHGEVFMGIVALDYIKRKNWKKAILVTDNMNIHQACQKGRSNNKKLNRMIRIIWNLRWAGFKIRTKWIPSKENPADAPSRSKNFPVLWPSFRRRTEPEANQEQHHKNTHSQKEKHILLI